MARNLMSLLRTFMTGSAACVCISSASAGLICQEYHEPPRWWTSPACEPTWGYHQTCWRKFPPVEPCPDGSYCPTGECNRAGGETVMPGQMPYGASSGPEHVVMPGHSGTSRYSTGPGYSEIQNVAPTPVYQQPTFSPAPSTFDSSGHSGSNRYQMPSTPVIPMQQAPQMPMQMQGGTSEGSRAAVPPLPVMPSTSVPMNMPGPMNGPVPAVPTPNQLNPIPMGPAPGASPFTPMPQPNLSVPQPQDQSSRVRTFMGTSQSARYGNVPMMNNSMVAEPAPETLSFRQSLTAAKGRYAGVPTAQSFAPPATLREGNTSAGTLPIRTVSVSGRPAVRPMTQVYPNRPQSAPQMPMQPMSSGQMAPQSQPNSFGPMLVAPAAKPYR